MDTGRIIYTGKSQSGIEYLIRYPTLDDAEAMSNYINTLSDERTFITYQGEKLTIDDEREYLQKELKKINEQKSVLLLVYSQNQLIGISGITLGTRTSEHVGTFGISLAKDFRGDGIGKVLMETIHKIAEDTMPKLKIISLGVFANNTLALEMYERFGYRKYGNLPEGLLYKGEYIDQIYMYKKIH